MKIKRLIITVFASFVMACLVALALRQMRTQEPEKPAGEQLPDAVIVFCFHGKTLPPKYAQLEKYTHETLQKSFANELKDGRLVWRVVNYESPEHATLASDFQLTMATIVVADARPDKTGIAKNLQKKVWELVDDKPAFQAYIANEVREALK
jgi:hypothetical protein